MMKSKMLECAWWIPKN